MKIKGLRAAVIAIAATIGFAGADALHAQSYPARPVTLIVPSAAGGGTDTIARLIGDQLTKQLGQGFVVENRTGGGMLVGTAAAAKAAPDGYTLLVGLTGNMSVNPSLFASLPYDPLVDFTPVAMLANYPFLVVVNNDLPANSIKELVALLKSQPGKIDYASAGNGTGQHLAPELFKIMTGTDTIARLIGDQLAKQLGQAFTVENRTGGGMLVGTTAAAKAAPDGYTLLVGLTGNMSVNPSLFAKLSYDPLADFTPVAMLANYPFLVVVNNDLPAKSIKELIALLKSRPGQIDYASAGNGTGQHLAPELFKMMTGTEMGHVPYRGAQPAYQDVISGRVPVFFDNMSTAMSLAKGGKVRALAITSKQRSALMPELPTVDEAGVPGYEYYTWFGLWAPKGTPQPIVEKLYAEVRTALADPALAQRIADTAGEPSNMAREHIEPFVKAEITKWAEVVKRAGIKVE